MPLRSTFEIGTQIILLKIDGFLKGWILDITPLKEGNIDFQALISAKHSQLPDIVRDCHFDATISKYVPRHTKKMLKKMDVWMYLSTVCLKRKFF